MKIIKKFLKGLIDSESRYWFEQWREKHRLTEHDIINLSVMLIVSGVEKPIINRLVKCQPAWSYIDAWEMGSIMLREDDERLLRHGVRVEGEITPESIILHLEYRYKYMLESHGFDVKDFYEE